jgi:hypothetical protein
VHGNFRRRKPLSVTETRKELSQFAAIAGRCAYNRMRPRDGARASAMLRQRNSKFRRSGFATADYPAFRIDPAIILRDHPLAMMSVLARAKGDPGRQATATALAIDYR